MDWPHVTHALPVLCAWSVMEECGYGADPGPLSYLSPHRGCHNAGTLGLTVYLVTSGPHVPLRTSYSPHAVVLRQ